MSSIFRRSTRRNVQFGLLLREGPPGRAESAFSRNQRFALRPAGASVASLDSVGNAPARRREGHAQPGHGDLSRILHRAPGKVLHASAETNEAAGGTRRLA